MKQVFILSIVGCLSLMHYPLNNDRCYLEKISTSIQKNENATAPVFYQYDSVKTKSEFRFRSNSRVDEGTFARIVFPVFADSKLNQFIKKTILSSFTTKHMFNNSLMATIAIPLSTDPIYQPACSYKNFTHNFIKQFESQTSDETLNTYWYADLKSTVLINTGEYISCLCEADYFAGGMHDEYDYSYINYDRRNHEIISLISQIKPGKFGRLSMLAEQIFRHNENLTPSQDLSNYFFDDNKFELTNNFTITKDGLKLLYIPNEIKPFASGTTELTIPFYMLKDIALTNSILSKYIAKD